MGTEQLITNQAEQLDITQKPLGETQQSRYKSPIFLIIIFIVVLMSLIGVTAAVLIYSTSRQDQDKQSLITKSAEKIQPISTSKTIESNNELDNLPPFHPDFQWQDNSQDDGYTGYQFLGENALNIDYDSYTLNGIQQAITTTGMSKNEFTNMRDTLVTYYENEAQNRGWTFDIETTNYRLTSHAADGPAGAVHGFLKEDQGNIRAFIYSYFTDFKGTLKTTENGEQDACPCDLTFRVFISDIMPLDQFLKKEK